jgi:hypothetical protein
MAKKYESQKRAHAAWSKRQREAGLCVSCPAPARPGKTQCERHAAQTNARVKAAWPKRLAWQRKMRGVRREKALCTLCAVPAVEGHSMCGRHRALSKKASTKYLSKFGPANGCCIFCAQPPVDGTVFCARHRELNRQRRRRHAAKVKSGAPIRHRAPRVPVEKAPLLIVSAPAKIRVLCACGLPVMTGRDLCWCCTNAERGAA